MAKELRNLTYFCNAFTKAQKLPRSTGFEIGPEIGVRYKPQGVRTADGEFIPHRQSIPRGGTYVPHICIVNAPSEEEFISYVKEHILEEYE